jgi:hypothetical protein
MATIHEEVLIDVEPAAAWSALADWGALHERLARGFVVDTRLDGADRIVTFASGLEVREVLITRDAEDRRLVWSVVDGPYTNHNGSAQILAGPDGQTRFVWIADLLPDAAAAPTGQAMRLGLAAMKEALEGDSDSA